MGEYIGWPTASDSRMCATDWGTEITEKPFENNINRIIKITLSYQQLKKRQTEQTSASWHIVKLQRITKSQDGSHLWVQKRDEIRGHTRVAQVCLFTWKVSPWLFTFLLFKFCIKLSISRIPLASSDYITQFTQTFQQENKNLTLESWNKIYEYLGKLELYGRKIFIKETKDKWLRKTACFIHSSERIQNSAG